MATRPILHVAIPAMNERAFIPYTLECLQRQTYKTFKIWVCVNQPENWWSLHEKLRICHDNLSTIEYLTSLRFENLNIIDHSSPGKGWKGNDHGVGQARKVIMDNIIRSANQNDIIVSLDADTTFNDDYLSCIVQVFERFPEAIGLSNPYYHKLTDDETLNRAILRYEIYMRYYTLNLWRIGSPYSFTALGSAISIPVWAYRKIGGMSAKKSGEDFYLLQKLRKSGWVANHNTSIVFPATRYSNRVFFGTGPALIKGSQGDWNSYPIYHWRFFDQIHQTYLLFPELFQKKVETPMSGFLNNHFGEEEIFERLRQNCRDIGRFVNACHQKVDGLRVLQFLKHSHGLNQGNDEVNLLGFLHKFYPGFFDNFDKSLQATLSFKHSDIKLLDQIRNFLMEKERHFQESDNP
ncbi:MAG TPA: glycosyltransferase family 2 protein [Bacteroidales bacterium]|nr:glycosyltransferase family 2 protein [Bacteroidales bacterium]